MKLQVSKMTAPGLKFPAEWKVSITKRYDVRGCRRDMAALKKTSESRQVKLAHPATLDSCQININCCNQLVQAVRMCRMAEMAKRTDLPTYVYMAMAS